MNNEDLVQQTRSSRYHKNKHSNVSNKHMLKIILTNILTILVLFWFYNTFFSKYSSSNFFGTIFFIFIILVLGMLLAINYIIISKDFKLERLYVLLIIPLSIIFNLLIIPGMVPDETTHMEFTYSISSQILGVEQDSKVTLRGEEKYVFDNLPKRAIKNNYKYTYSHLFSGEDNGEYVKTNKNSANWKQAFGYFPAIVGVSVGRILHVGATPTFFLGRICNALVAIIITYKAIKRIPIGKQLLFILALLPITIQQYNSLSYDSMLISCAFFCTAYGLYMVYDCKSVHTKSLIGYLLAGLVLMALKSSIYAFILMIPIFAKFHDLDDNKAIAHKQKAIIFLTLAIFILLLNFVQFGQSSTSTISANEFSKHIVSWSGTEGYSMPWILSHPIESINVLIETFNKNGDFYFHSLFGSVLSWFTVNINDMIANSWFVLALLGAFENLDKEHQVTKRLKVLFGLIFLSGFGLSILAMWTHWTPLSYNFIAGVQGRYFLPVIFMLLMIFNNRFIKINKGSYRYINILTLILIMVSVSNIVITCF